MYPLYRYESKRRHNILGKPLDTPKGRAYTPLRLELVTKTLESGKRRSSRLGVVVASNRPAEAVK
jgi:hypothetical protein